MKFGFRILLHVGDVVRTRLRRTMITIPLISRG